MSSIQWSDSETFERFFSEREPFAKFSSGPGQLTVESVERFSRNTIVCRFRAGGKSYVAKVSVTKEPEIAEREYQQLLDFKRQLTDQPGVGTLNPVAYFADVGMIITEEVPGDSLRQWVLRGIQESADSETRQQVEVMVKEAACALRKFHLAFTDPGLADPFHVGRVYLDYGPGNILSMPSEKERGGWRMVLLDLPEENRSGSCFFDVGTFCFELGRCALRKGRWLPSQFRWVNELKRIFIETYVGLLDVPLSVEVMDRVRSFEMERIETVLGYYRNFGQFENRLKEFTRFAVSTLLITHYRKRIMPVSYSQSLS